MRNSNWMLRAWSKLQQRFFPQKDHSKTRASRVSLGIEFLEDRLSPAQVAFAITQDWGSGFQGQLAITNALTDPAVADWQLEFDYDAQVNSIWDARIVSHVQSHYVVANAGWNSTLVPGGSVSFGFVASPGSTFLQPANYRLNGQPLGPTPPSPPMATLSVADVTVSEGNQGIGLATFTVNLSQASTLPVTVNYTTQSGTANAGSDFQASSGRLTFEPGEVQKLIAVSINGDTDLEADETFALILSDAVHAVIERGQASGTIGNDDQASGSDLTFRVDSDWGSGFTGTITLRNSSSVTIPSWSLAFDFAGQIASIWNATIAAHQGDHYVVEAMDWNRVIAPGATVSFGFVASPGGGGVSPRNFVLNGQANTNLPPVAHDDLIRLRPGTSIAIAVLANDSDPNGDPLEVTEVGPGQHGSVVLNSNGSLTYTPAAGFSGIDSFTYTISDGRGGTASAMVNVTVADPAVSTARFFAPYVDMTLYPTYDLVATARNQGLDFFTLAFIVADGRGQPSWGGYEAYAVNGGDFDIQIRTQLAQLRSLGGDAMVSFGGAANQELAQVITEVQALTSAYQTVIDAYQLTHIDFDIEGAACADHASIDLRSQAIALLQQHAAAAGRELHVWFTLPVLPSGLTNDGLYVVQSALRFGVTVAGVNIMAMDYGDNAAPNPQGQMGEYAIQAATSLFAQLRSLYGPVSTDSQLWQMVGVTPMIGRNDVVTEVFDQEDARQLLAWGEQQGLSRLSLWSLNRDRQSPAGAINYVEPTSSSVLQEPWEFSLIFQSFSV